MSGPWPLSGTTLMLELTTNVAETTATTTSQRPGTCSKTHRQAPPLPHR
jgi:hypothetical protein